METLPYTALFGGSFNPPHSGHFRMALEVMEALRPRRFLFMHCATPPHKPADNLLSFDLRVCMLEAAIRAKEAGEAKGLAHSLAEGSACASEAFFPFADGLLEAVAAGATAVIQPGGSIRDDEVIAAADDKGIAMAFTGVRVFRH